MCAMQYFDELRSILARMDQLLPPCEEQASLPSFASPEKKRGPSHAVIEAKATAISHFRPSSTKWRFEKQEIPLLYQGQESRRAFVLANTMQSTAMSDQTTTAPDASPALPPGVTLWHTSDSARRMLLLARRDLEMLFAEGLESGLLPYSKEEGGVFALPPGKQICFRDSMALIRNSNPYLHRVCWEYAGLAAHMFGIHLKDFSTLARVLIQRLDSKAGTPARLLDTSQAKYDGGPVLLVSLGLPTTVHDLLPTLPAPDHTREYPTRITVAEGFMLVLDGDTRFRYSHGFPGGQQEANWFYTITIFLDSLSKSSLIGYERETRTMVMSTPMQMEHIITTRPEIPNLCPISLHRDSLWRLVQGLRLRLRSAESFTLAQTVLMQQQLKEKQSPTELAQSHRAVHHVIQ